MCEVIAPGKPYSSQSQAMEKPVACCCVRQAWDSVQDGEEPIRLLQDPYFGPFALPLGPRLGEPWGLPEGWSLKLLCCPSGFLGASCLRHQAQCRGPQSCQPAADAHEAQQEEPKQPAEARLPPDHASAANEYSAGLPPPCPPPSTSRQPLNGTQPMTKEPSEPKMPAPQPPFPSAS